MSEPEPEPEAGHGPAGTDIAAVMHAPPGFIGNLDAAQTAALDEMRVVSAAELASAAGQRLSVLLRGDDFVLIRFLRATEFVVPYAHRVLQKCLEWRAAQGLFAEDPKRQQLFERIAQMFPAGYHRYTTRGEPVELWRIGQFWPAEIMEQFSREEIEHIWFHHLECSLYAQRDVAVRLGWDGGTAGLVLVMDLQGMGKRHLAPSVLKLVSGLFGIGQKMYPENVNRILVVNAPKLFELGFSAVKPALHENTIKKIAVASSANTELLGEMLGGNHRLPTFLGGMDTDCTIGHPEVDDADWVVVRAGERYTQQLHVPPASEGSGVRVATISFQSRSFGARFSVWRQPDFQVVRPSERVCVRERQLYPSHVHLQRVEMPLGLEGCMLELEFDNSDSWMTALEVVCNAAIKPP